MQYKCAIPTIRKIKLLCTSLIMGFSKKTDMLGKKEASNESAYQGEENIFGY